MRVKRRTKLAVAGSVDECASNGSEDARQELGGLDLVDESDARHGERMYGVDGVECWM